MTKGSCTSQALVNPPEDKRNTAPAPSPGKWYKFNDVHVDEFEMTAESLEAECFGGTYKSRAYDLGM